MVREKVPTHLTVTIDLKWAESMKQANLDINEETLLFEYPELYYLDLNLKYKVNPDEGNAKFDKTKKTLTIKLPVVGLTKDSQKVIDDHYNKYVKEQEERLKQLETVGENDHLEENQEGEKNDE